MTGAAVPDAAVPALGRVDTIDVWSVSLDRPASEVGPLRTALSSDERARLDRFRRPDDAARFLVGRALLREILGRYVQREAATIRFRTGPFGKPALADDESVRFSFSRSGGKALVAVAHDREVGVDLETIRPGPAEDLVASAFLAPAEREALEGLPSDRRRAAFFACWTRKEAILKAIGRGLSIAPHRFAVSVTPGEPRISIRDLDGTLGATAWRLLDLDLGPRHAAAVAAAGDDWRARIVRRPSWRCGGGPRSVDSRR